MAFNVIAVPCANDTKQVAPQAIPEALMTEPFAGGTTARSYFGWTMGMNVALTEQLAFMAAVKKV